MKWTMQIDTLTLDEVVDTYVSLFVIYYSGSTRIFMTQGHDARNRHNQHCQFSWLATDWSMMLMIDRFWLTLLTYRSDLGSMTTLVMLAHMSQSSGATTVTMIW